MEIFSSGVVNCSMKWHFMKSPSDLKRSRPSCARQKLARVGQVLLHQLLHLLLDGFQVLGRERLLAIEVVEEAALGRRAVAELGLGKEFEHGSRHQVSRRVAIDFQRLGIAVGKQAQLDILLQRAREVDQLRVVLRRLGGWRRGFASRHDVRCRRCRSRSTTAA